MEKDIMKMIAYSDGGILSKIVERDEKLNITLFCMAADTSISEHTSTKQGFVYVVEGEGVFNLEGKDINMRPGVYIHMEKNAIHSLKAGKNTSFLLVLSGN